MPLLVNAETVEDNLTELMDQCLESLNQQTNIRIDSVDLKNQKITMTFDYHVVESDEYIGFGAY